MIGSIDFFRTSYAYELAAVEAADARSTRATDEPGRSPAQDGRDRVEISEDARRLALQRAAGVAESEAGEETGAEQKETGTSGSSQTGEEGLTEEEQQEVKELKQRDREVRAHEQAHLAAAGNLANGRAQFEYTAGPDGQRYATGGEVSIDTSPEKDPQDTITKAARIRQAALAPADPSAQDRRVAAEASAMAAEAQQELSQTNSGSAE
jgi:hypothetical protein